MKSLRKTLISLGLVASMLAASPLGTVKAAADGEGKYVSEVYVAYGANEQEASQWLKDNGWEPVSGDLGAGKNSKYDTAVSAVMGIHRTGNAADAITDMAVMNMKGAYSFDMYTEIINEKKTELNAFLDSFTPALEEYRANLNGEGSEAGKARAELVRDMLNKFYDGEVDGEYALNDTGKPLGDLLSTTTKHEFGDEAYDALPKEDKLKYGDLQQILLESTPSAVLVVERLLSLATDDGEESWLDRLSALEGENLADEIEALDIGATPGISESAAETLLAEKYEDVAVNLSQQWGDIHNELVWYTEYTEGHDLYQKEDESLEAYSDRTDPFFTELAENDDATLMRYNNTETLFALLMTTEYEGEWGSTLLEFFMPEDGTDYTGNFEEFTRLAAALSEGQRAAMSFLPLNSLLMIGTNDEEAVESVVPDMNDLFADSETISIYSGMKRQIFRDGVALTSEALAEKNNNRDPYESIFDINGWLDIAAYATAAVGAVTFISSAIALGFLKNGTKNTGAVIESVKNTGEVLRKEYRLQYSKINQMETLKNFKDLDEKALENAKSNLATAKQYKFSAEEIAGYQERVDKLSIKMEEIQRQMDYLEGKPVDELKPVEGEVIEQAKQGENKAAAASSSGTKIAGTLMVVGGVLMLAGAGVKAYSYLNNMYHKDFTKIPLMIVDEADIVTYRTDASGNQILDENGKPIRDINFDQFAYYDAVKCNRQLIGVNKEAQNGVDSYAEWGCGDVADLNCDYGKEWLALYTNKSSAKGNPILADSLTVQYGSNALPENCTKSLHTFRNTYAFNVANDTYSFNDKKNGIYLFWNEDPEAYGTAGAAGSVFGTGLAALFGVGGLGLGVLGTMLVMMPKRKKEETNSVSIG